MYTSVNDFIKDWEYESESTLKILNNLTDESLNKKNFEGVRSLGRLAWHLIGTISEMGSLADLDIEKVEDKYSADFSAQEICELYKKTADSLKNDIQIKWSDEILKEEVNMYGEKWTKGTSLEVIIKHQIHHRGQLTVIMRLNGLKVPGVYGPAYEEWAHMGMQPMD